MTMMSEGSGEPRFSPPGTRDFAPSDFEEVIYESSNDINFEAPPPQTFDKLQEKDMLTANNSAYTNNFSDHQATKATNMASPKPGPVVDDLQVSLKRLYESGLKDADILLICGGKKLRVHGFILSLRSSFFHTAINGNFKEATTKEIHLPDDNPFMISRLIQHCYTVDYTGLPTTLDSRKETPYISELHTHATMYALGDKYDMRDLKTESAAKFEHAIKANKGKGGERSAVLNVVSYVYSSTPDSDNGLRGIVSDFAMEHWSWFAVLQEVRVGAPKQFVWDVAEKLGQFAHQVKRWQKRVSYHE